MALHLLYNNFPNEKYQTTVPLVNSQYLFTRISCSILCSMSTPHKLTSLCHSNLGTAATSVVLCCSSSASFFRLKLLTWKRLRVPCSFSFPKIQRRPGRPQTWLSLLQVCLAARLPYRWQKSMSGRGITSLDFEEHLTSTLTDGKLTSLSDLTDCVYGYILEQ